MRTDQRLPLQRRPLNVTGPNFEAARLVEAGGFGKEGVSVGQRRLGVGRPLIVVDGLKAARRAPIRKRKKTAPQARKESPRPTS